LDEKRVKIDAFEVEGVEVGKSFEEAIEVC
jgi:hypothetical protein